MKFKKIYIEITNICNLSCDFCSILKREKQYMNAQQFEFIIKQIKPFCKFVYLHIKGEPLIHPNLMEFLDICEKHGMKANLTTNGILLGEKKTELLSKPALRQVNISVHSFAFQEKQMQTDYLNHLIAFCKACDEKNAPYVSLRMWNYDQQGFLAQENQILVDSLRSAFPTTQLLEGKIEKKENIKLTNTIFMSLDKQFKWPSLENNFVSNLGRCYGTIKMVGILVDGTVVPCCLDGNGEAPLGNIFDLPFSEIINSNLFLTTVEKFHQNRVHLQLCKHCEFRKQFPIR